MVCQFIHFMRMLAENRLAEVEMIKRRFPKNKEGMEPFGRNVLLQRVRGGAGLMGSGHGNELISDRIVLK